MPFCPKCGVKIAGSFCPKCGTKKGISAANISYSMLAAACFFIAGALIIYNGLKLSEARVLAGQAFIGVPLALLCLYLGYETYNKKKWALPWGVISGVILFLSYLAVLVTPGLSWWHAGTFLATGGAALFAYLGKAEYAVEDKENPLAKFTQP